MSTSPRADPGALTRLFIRNTTANFALKVITVLLQLTATAWVVTTYGDGLYGILVIAMQVSGLMNVIAPGLSGAFTREVAAHSKADDALRLRALIRLGTRLYLGLGLLLGVALAGFGAMNGPSWSLLRIAPERLDDAAWIFIAAGLAVAFRWPLGVYGDVLAGLQEYPRLALIRSAAAGVGAATTIWIAVNGWPIATVLFAQAVLRLFEGLWLRHSALRRLPPLDDSTTGETVRARSFLRPLASVGRWIGLIDISRILNYQADVVIILMLISDTAVGAYWIAAKLHNLVREAQGVLASAIPSLIAREASAGNHAAVEQILYRGTRYNLVIIVPVTIAAALFAGDFLALWLGEERRALGGLAAAFVSYWAFSAMTTFAAQAASGMAKVRELGWIAIGCALVNVSASVLLARPYGIAGVVSATLMAYALAIPLQMLFVFPRIGVSLQRFLREVILPIYPLSFLLLLAFAALRIWVVRTPTTMLEMLFQAGIVGSISLALLAWVALDQRDRARLLRRLRGS